MPVDPALVGYRQAPFEATIERGRLRAFAAAIGGVDPVAVDLDAARAAGHPDLVVPPTFLFGVDLENSDTFDVLSAHGVPVDQVLHGEQSFEYLAPIHAGDTLRFESEFTSVQSKAGGRLEIIDRVTTVTRSGSLVARLANVSVVQNGGYAMKGIAVGDELPTLTAPAISRTALALFAGASGDHNPIHIDIDAAKAAGRDDVFAHGMLSMAYLGRMLTAWTPQADLLSWRVRFTSITPVHAAPVCTGTVTAIEDTEDGRRATVDVRVALEDGTPTIAGTALVRPP